MRSTLNAVAAVLVLLTAVSAFAATEPEDKSKRTASGKYATAAEAYEAIQKAPDKAVLLDVRTPEEYVFVGHPAMAPNIPVLTWTGKFDPEKKHFGMSPNQKFVELTKAKFSPDKTLYVICRSGQRSAKAADILTQAGFANVYSVVDGFEGDVNKDQASPDFGKRVVNGWKNSKLPWTQDLDPTLVYDQL